MDHVSCHKNDKSDNISTVDNSDIGCNSNGMINRDVVNIIDVSGLYFSYNNKNKVLDGVNLKINQGEFVCIVGPNGSGKSTLVKHFNGLLIPSSGRVTAIGHLTTDKEHVFDIRKNIAMVFQNPDNQIVSSIVEEDVAFALENLGVSPTEIRTRVSNVLKIVDMAEFEKHSVHNLSGGQKQKVAIASAIAMMPKCIIFDESTSMLDPTGRRSILNLIIKLVKEQNITVVFVTHFMDEACFADRLIVMNDGKIVIDDKPVNVFKKGEGLTEIGLELPEITKLCQDLRHNNLDIGIQTTIESVADRLENVLNLNKF